MTFAVVLGLNIRKSINRRKKLRNCNHQQMTNDDKITKFTSVLTFYVFIGYSEKRCIDNNKKKKEAEKKIVCTRGR